MRTCPFGKLERSGAFDWRLAILLIAGAQVGCTLPGTEQSLLSSFPVLNKVVPESPAQACMTAARKLERKGQIQPAIDKYEEARRLEPTPVARVHSLDAGDDAPRRKIVT